jgi:FkbM family methyltransferase
MNDARRIGFAAVWVRVRFAGRRIFGWVKADWRFRQVVTSYSQEQEDVLLDLLLRKRETGFYVDIGCHHPFRLSNTYLLYRRGWHGVAVDPNADLIEMFAKYRPRDLALCRAIAGSHGEKTYYEFKESAYNTLNDEVGRDVVANGHSTLLRQHKIAVCPFSDIQDGYLPPGQHVDLLSIDVEGNDLDVLQSIDWTRFTPDLVVAEEHTNEAGLCAPESPIEAFLRTKGYWCRARVRRSAIYQHCTPDAARSVVPAA